MRARGWLLIALAVAAVLLLVGRTATALYVDQAWFTAMGVPALFREQLIDSLLLQGGAWLVGSAFAFANLHAVRRTILAVAVPSRVANLELTAMVPGQRLFTATLVVSLIVGVILALPLTNWEVLALVRHGQPFGEIDGIFGKDLGHYVYWLPFEETLYLWSLVCLVSLTTMVLVLYALTRSLRLEGRRLSASTHVRRHLSVLGALVLLLLAWSYRLDAFDLLQQGSGPDGMFLRVDHRVTLRMDAVLAYGSAVAALVVLRTGWTGQLRAAFLTLTAILVGAVGLRHIVPAVAQRTQGTAAAARRDLDYVASRALYSRRAYDVDAMRTTGPDSTNSALLPTTTATLGERASLWDRSALPRGLGERSASTPTDSTAPGGSRMIEAAPVSWTVRNGHVHALRVRRPMASSERWSLTLVDATRPALRDSVLEPLASVDEDPSGQWPLVGPGLTGARLLDASRSPEVQGAPLTTRTTRVAHAWALRDASLLQADTMAASPMLVRHRDVRERVRRLAPVFEQGADVLPLLDGERLYWVVHLYSASDRYPFSQRWQINGSVYSYYKHAGTALVDAASGRVRVIPAPRPDAVARTWMRALPALYVSASALPASLVAQLPPVSEGATLQARTFSRYGSRAEGTTLRHLADSAFVGGPPAPWATSTGPTARIAWSVPLLDSGDLFDGVVTAIGGSEPTTWWTPLSGARPRWAALRDQLQVALDSVRLGATERSRRDGRFTMTRPEPLVTTRGVLVMQSVQMSRGDGSVIAARVAVTDGTRTGAGATLTDALAALGETVVRSGPTSSPLIGTDAGGQSAGRWYDTMREALRRGDWAAFGAAFDSLGQVLKRPSQ